MGDKCAWFHVFCAAVYGAMALWVQYEYYFNPGSLFVGWLTVGIMMVTAVGMFIPAFMCCFPHVLATPGAFCCKLIYFLLLAGSITCQILFGAMLCTGKDWVPESTNSTLTQMFQDWDGDGPVAKSWDILHEGYFCCGINDISDWQDNSPQFVDYAEHQPVNITNDLIYPDSCCTDGYRFQYCGLMNGDYNNNDWGCLQFITEYALYQAIIAGGIIVSISGMEFICITWTFVFGAAQPIETPYKLYQ
ncbi:Oidioi.mRNA.OKI2018_I69.XSR.g15094.t1.cds [Oikopleura dioica]|uniref:Oidioi.mRNA.OKI2018_I69.XSR.g15094.t1.cds n=1 Tax=Oikopleura dioica TaxID=34765 RepID=A0ABN7SDI1_OIKDI|nr:Oidioi.mRNA.OKI2018_I69.XSR.g15094.t1.cds [Oikopleura dioica]